VKGFEVPLNAAAIEYAEAREILAGHRLKDENSESVSFDTSMRAKRQRS
jgi:hypothetical protein